MIFEPFYQGSHQRKGAVKGSGLGLSIARDCVRQMQGELSLEESESGLICFRITLPAAEPEKPTHESTMGEYVPLFRSGSCFQRMAVAGSFLPGAGGVFRRFFAAHGK